MNASPQLILVTGATGALGRRVVARLIAEGHSIRVLTRRPFAAARLFGATVEMIEWHPMAGEPPVAAFEGLDAIIHLAGEPLAGAADRERIKRIRSSRLKLAERLAVAARRSSLRLVVASVVLPPADRAPGAVITDQSTRQAPTTAFERDMLDVEAACNALAGGGASLALVRLGILLDDGPLIRDLVRLARRGQIPQLAGCLIPAIDPEDAAALLTGLVAQPDITGPLIGVAPEPLKGEFVQTALTQLNRLPLTLPLPVALLERQVGPLARLLVNRAHVVPQRLLDAGAGFSHGDLEASLMQALTLQRDAAARTAGGTSRLITRMRQRAGQ